MSIDTVKTWLKIQRVQRHNKLNHLAPSLIGDKRIESLDTAVSYLEDYQELLNKYQKIEEIVNNTFQNITKEDERYAYEWLGNIKEVIEDENDDW